jgi:predicted nucleic acid-binding protein
VATVIADAGPLHYLNLIGMTDILPRLFGVVVVPEMVVTELSRERTPGSVREWIAAPSTWLHLRQHPPVDSLPFPELGDGERAVLSVAAQLKADLLLMDDLKARTVAIGNGFAVSGTIGVLDRAATRGWIDRATAVDALSRTNFRVSHGMLNDLLGQHRDRG